MKIIVANWKMNGDLNFANKFIEEINSVDSKNTVVVCPQTPLIGRFYNFRYYLGAQNCFYEENGAFTGENSPKLLKQMGCKYVILGHSERRSVFNEEDNLIFKKWKTALNQKLIPIVCLGEKLEDRNRWKKVVSDQLGLFLNESLGNTIFAYEPVWSIGTGIIPGEDEIVAAFEFMKNLLGQKVSLLYGGSVNSKNAQSILGL
ncbi:MAG: triose-phosphate isomerase, partial [Holosporaceae bacterium]|nr:triose-phosphate isomerase [Holosporaceae bacterium]